MKDPRKHQALEQVHKLWSWSNLQFGWKTQGDPLAGQRQSPFRLFWIMIVAIFLAEVFAMILIDIISKSTSRPIPYFQITLIDAGIMTILIFPVLYSFSFHPLVRHYEAERDAHQMTETMRAVSQSLAQSLDLDTVLNTLLKHISALVPNDVGSIGLLEDETRFVMRVAEGFAREPRSSQAPVLPVDVHTEIFFQKLEDSHASLLIYDAARDAEWIEYSDTTKIRNWLGVPILVNDQVSGVVLLGKQQPGAFTRRHAELAEALVSQAAVAIQNAWLFEQVRAGRERLQFLSRRLVEIQETERRYIARELHDQAGQSLSSLLLGLGQLEKDVLISANNQTQVQKLKTLTNDILEDLHRLAVNLRPASLDHLGLVPALHQFIKSFAEETPLPIHFKAVGLHESDRLPSDVETTLYRIVQESLTNILRHAKASYADVILECRDSSLLLIVEDDGMGFDVELSRSNHHLGLLGIRERAEMLGGNLTIESVPGQGTTLVVEVPHVNPNPVGR